MLTAHGVPHSSSMPSGLPVEWLPRTPPMHVTPGPRKSQVNALRLDTRQVTSTARQPDPTGRRDPPDRIHAPPPAANCNCPRSPTLSSRSAAHSPPAATTPACSARPARRTRDRVHSVRMFRAPSARLDGNAQPQRTGSLGPRKRYMPCLCLCYPFRCPYSQPMSY